MQNCKYCIERVSAVFPHPGWSEQKPEDWWESKQEILRAGKDVDKSQVAGISFGGQMHGLVILDENDRHPPGDPLERRPYCKTDRLSEHRNRKENSPSTPQTLHLQAYRTEDSLGERK